MEGPEKYLLGHASALAVNLIRFLQQQESQTGISDLIDEYLLHEALERTQLEHHEIIDLTSQLFHRPPATRAGETPLGRALRAFIDAQVQALSAVPSHREPVPVTEEQRRREAEDFINAHVGELEPEGILAGLSDSDRQRLREALVQWRMEGASDAVGDRLIELLSLEPFRLLLRILDRWSGGNHVRRRSEIMPARDEEEIGEEFWQQAERFIAERLPILEPTVGSRWPQVKQTLQHTLTWWLIATNLGMENPEGDVREELVSAAMAEQSEEILRTARGWLPDFHVASDPARLQEEQDILRGEDIDPDNLEVLQQILLTGYEPYYDLLYHYVLSAIAYVLAANQNPRAQEILLKALRHPMPSIRAIIAEELDAARGAHWPRDESQQALRLMALQEWDALASFGERHPDDAIAALRLALEGPEEDPAMIYVPDNEEATISEAAVRCLNHLGVRALPVLLDLLVEKVTPDAFHGYTVEAVVRTVVTLSRAVEPRLLTDSVRPMMQQALERLARYQPDATDTEIGDWERAEVASRRVMLIQAIEEVEHFGEPSPGPGASGILQQPTEFFQTGQALMRTGQYAEAITAYQKALVGDEANGVQGYQAIAQLGEGPIIEAARRNQTLVQQRLAEAKANLLHAVVDPTVLDVASVVSVDPLLTRYYEAAPGESSLVEKALRHLATEQRPLVYLIGTEALKTATGLATLAKLREQIAQADATHLINLVYVHTDPTTSAEEFFTSLGLNPARLFDLGVDAVAEPTIELVQAIILDEVNVNVQRYAATHGLILPRLETLTRQNTVTLATNAQPPVPVGQQDREARLFRALLCEALHLVVAQPDTPEELAVADYSRAVLSTLEAFRTAPQVAASFEPPAPITEPLPAPSPAPSAPVSVEIAPDVAAIQQALDEDGELTIPPRPSALLHDLDQQFKAQRVVRSHV